MDSIKPRSKHIPYLDGARGIAAFTVFIYHIAELQEWKGTKGADIIDLLFNGADAVSFFFVLSGFVLSYKYLHAQPFNLRLSLKEYVNNRFWRIYPAFWATLIIYVMAINHTYTLNIPSLLWNHTEAFREATLVHNVNGYNAADWTLGVEITLSLVLPIFMLVIIKSRWWFWASLIFFILAYKAQAQFLFHFMLGIAIAWYYPVLASLRSTCPRLYRMRWFILPLMVLLFDSRHLPKFLPEVDTFLSVSEHNFFLTAFTYSAIAAGVFIVYFLNSRRAQYLLSLKPVLFLGKISYSIYLVQGLWAWSWQHYFISRLQTYFASNSMVYVMYIVIGGAGVIITATMSYYLFERPGMVLGKAFYRKYIARHEVIGDKGAI